MVNNPPTSKPAKTCWERTNVLEVAQSAVYTPGLTGYQPYFLPWVLSLPPLCNIWSSCMGISFSQFWAKGSGMFPHGLLGSMVLSVKGNRVLCPRNSQISAMLVCGKPLYEALNCLLVFLLTPLFLFPCLFFLISFHLLCMHVCSAVHE